jgi:hypothetical protein
MTTRGAGARQTKQSGKPPDKCGNFPSGSITTVLDAPNRDLETSPLPRMFRSCLDPLKQDPKPPSVKGLKEINASGSAQYSKGQMAAVLGSGRVRKPLMVVDLRQESHGFLHVKQPLFEESTIAVGWFVERDWMNVGKGLPSIELDQRQRVSDAAGTPQLTVNWISKKTAEDGICIADPYLVYPAAPASEREILEAMGLKYLRFPTTDHVRPSDAEVDQFVRIAAKLTRDTWLHFHCRGGDGRTTTFIGDVRHYVQRPGRLSGRHRAPAVSGRRRRSRQTGGPGQLCLSVRRRAARLRARLLRLRVRREARSLYAYLVGMGGEEGTGRVQGSPSHAARASASAEAALIQSVT